MAGFTVGVTAARRHEELVALLERRGAQVVYAPAIRLMPLADDSALLAATRETLAHPVDDVVVTTGIGLRAWLETADGWGLRDALIGHLNGTRILARGPKARGAVRAAGMTEAWSPESESCEEVLSHLLRDDVTGRRIVVQLYGEPTPLLTDPLRRAGAEVLEIPVYRWASADDPLPLRRLVGHAVAGTVDAITFTSAPAVTATLAAAASDDAEESLLSALRTQVVAACVGPVTARPLDERGVPTVCPERARLGALVRALVAELPVRRTSRLAVHGHALELRGHAVVVDGQLRPIPRAPMAILQVLARRPGHVVSRAELRRALPSGSPGGGLLTGRPRADEHAVEMAVARLRRCLGRSGLIETVVKRGYRLACDPAPTAHDRAS
ncbi:uroporphyrinogen-III synthase [Actinomadura sp. HBU206391]|nr:uroporphyrinogen-III synthase [Actinomadura sp. HBU206391]